MRCRIRTENGASLVELAIIAPLLLILLFGILEFGALLYDYVMLRNLSREFARSAATFYVNPSSSNPQDLPCSKACSDVVSLLNKNPIIINFVNPLDSKNPIQCGSCDNRSPATENSINMSVCCREIYDSGGRSGGHIYSAQAAYKFQFLVFEKLVNFLNGGDSLSITAQSTMRDEAPGS